MVNSTKIIGGKMFSVELSANVCVCKKQHSLLLSPKLISTPTPNKCGALFLSYQFSYQFQWIC